MSRCPRVSVGLDARQWAMLDAWRDGRPRSVVLAKALAVFLRSQDAQAAAGLDDWRPEPSSMVEFRTVPMSTVCYLRSPHSSEGGHQIAQGGRTVWVLPDGRTSGQLRSRPITGAVAACEGLALDAVAYVWGVLALAQKGRGAGLLVDRGTG